MIKPNKKIKKTLALQTEVIRSLDAAALERAVGGRINPTLSACAGECASNVISICDC